MSIQYYESSQGDVTVFDQWGLFQQLLIEGAPMSPLPTILISNGCCGEVYSVTPHLDGGRLRVDIPNEILAQSGSMLVHVVQSGAGEGVVSIDKVRIPIRAADRPTDYDEIIEIGQEHTILRYDIGRLSIDVFG